MDKLMKMAFALIGLTGLGTLFGIRKTRKQIKVEHERIDRMQDRQDILRERLNKNEDEYIKELKELQDKIDELNAKLSSRRTGGKA